MHSPTTEDMFKRELARLPERDAREFRSLLAKPDIYAALTLARRINDLRERAGDEV